MTIGWSEVEALAARMPVAAGYRLGLLRRDEIGAVVDRLADWFPEGRVGHASRYLDAAFYEREVWFADGPRRDVIVVVLRHGDGLAGMFGVEFDPDALAAHAQLGAAAPAHHGAGLARAGMAFSEALGRRLGMGAVYGTATLKSPYVQRAFERAGWQLAGFWPGLDREQVAPGVVRRVFEALYAKRLVGDNALQWPDPSQMTPTTRAAFERLLGCAAP